MLKKIIILLLITIQLYAVPSWFNTRKTSNEDTIYYGYGVANSEKSARANALREIAEQISSSVSSHISMTEYVTNEYISQNLDSSTFVSSKQTLNDTKVIRSEKEGGKFYVLMKHIYTMPFWYETRSFEAPLFSIIGYGIGSNMKEALINARGDISAQISSNITSSTTISTTQVNEKMKEEFKENISFSTSLIMKESKVIKSEKVGKHYFVALVHRKVPKLKCVQHQNKFLRNIELIKKANRLTPCPYSYELVRMNSKWHLYSDGFMQELSYSQFDSFFTSISTATLKISSEYSSYQLDDVFRLEVESKKGGYLSIIAVYENGKVGVMLENRKISKNKLHYFPSKEDNIDLVAGLNEENRATKDLYFAFVTPERINLAKFETISDHLLGEKEYRFNQVINLCKNHDFATTLIRTTPKKRVKRFLDIKSVEESSFSWFFRDELESALDDLEYKEKDSRKWAFIISLEDYEFSDTIKYATNSAKIFKLMASKKLAISDEQIFFLKDSEATAVNIAQKLKELVARVKDGDSIYFYFVGQGLPVPKENNEPYLLVYDKSVANVSQDKNLKLQNIYKELASSKAGKVFVFLDTTFSGATDGVSVFKGVAAPKLRPKKIKFPKKKMSILLAGRDTQFSNMYKQKHHRLFSYFLIDGIVNQNIQEIGYLYKYIEKNVNEISFELGDDYIQTPLLEGNIDAKL